MSSGVSYICVYLLLDMAREKLGKSATNHKDEAIANKFMHRKKVDGAQEQAEQEKTGAGQGAMRVAVCQGAGGG